MMDRDQAFPPIFRKDAKVLVLGSLPGKRSIQEAQYYGHPRNHFWKIMGDLLQFSHKEPYEDRIEILKERRIALWDVCQSAYRPGSLDSSIKKELANDIPSLLKETPSIELIGFNGQKPQQLFQKHFPDLNIPAITLLSTSPANASFSYTDKLNSWKRILNML